MDITSASVRVRAEAGEMPAFLARPTTEETYPGVVVVQEAFGLNDHIRDIASRLARDGYVTLAPNLYYREPNAVAGYNNLPEALRLMSTLWDETVVKDMGAAIAYLRQQPAVRADRIGVTGFCMGGRIAFLTACMNPAVKAAVPFYGGGIGHLMQPSDRTPKAPLEYADRLTASLLLFFGGEDSFIPLDEVDLIKHRLAELKKNAETVVYPGAPHGFFCTERDSYRPDAAKDAWERMLKFFTLHLKAETA
jgi:carboxymethylenebutenolidase